MTTLDIEKIMKNILLNLRPMHLRNGEKYQIVKKSRKRINTYVHNIEKNTITNNSIFFLIA